MRKWNATSIDDVAGPATEASSSRVSVRLFVMVSAIAGVLYAITTPPFRVPDEVGHFWRGFSIADGHFVVPASNGRTMVPLPEGVRTLVFVMSPNGGEGRVTRERFRTAWELPMLRKFAAPVAFPAVYTAIAYAPQSLAAFTGDAAGLHPLLIFYFGRLANLAAFIFIIACAIHIAPFGKPIFCAAALLPMTLYLAASWSPDAMAIASAFLFSALLLRASHRTAMISRNETAALALSGALVGLCKPGYSLIALLVLAVPPARALGRRRAAVVAIVLIATLGGVAFSVWNARLAFTPRVDIAVNPLQQWECIESDPLRFAGIALRTFRANAIEYAGQMIGRLGMLDVRLPSVVFLGEMVLLGICALAAGGRARAGVRVICAVIAIAISAGIAVTLYTTWTPGCAAMVEGVQGRYFLPVLPLVLIVVSAPLLRERFAQVAVLVTAALGNGAALIILASRYY